MEKITWRVGKGETHSIPEGAVISVRGKSTLLSVFIDKDGEISFESMKHMRSTPVNRKRK